MVVPAFYIKFLQVRLKMYLEFLSCGNYVLDSYIQWRLSVSCGIRNQNIKIYYIVNINLTLICIILFVIYIL